MTPFCYSSGYALQIDLDSRRVSVPEISSPAPAALMLGSINRKRLAEQFIPAADNRK
jgi:hypothetical protein